MQMLLAAILVFCALLLLGITILWVVMPGGAEPGTPSRLMWENFLPWRNRR